MFSKIILRIRVKMMNELLKLAGVVNIRGHLIYKNSLPETPVVIDIGANKGLFSQKMTELYGAECYAVEANKELYESIHVTKGRKFNLAINDKDEHVTFYVCDDNQASSIIEDFQNVLGQTKPVQVEGVSWPTLLSITGLKERRIDVLKLDIEGAELVLIESFNKESLKNVGQVTVEFHDWINPGLHERTLRSIKKMNDFGFDGYTSTPNHTCSVEIVFVNKNLVRFSSFDAFVLKIFNGIEMLKYKS